MHILTLVLMAVNVLALAVHAVLSLGPPYDVMELTVLFVVLPALVGLVGVASRLAWGPGLSVGVGGPGRAVRDPPAPGMGPPARWRMDTGGVDRARRRGSASGPLSRRTIDERAHAPAWQVIDLKTGRARHHGVLADYRCSHSIAISGDVWPDDVRLSDIEPRIVCQACGHRGADVRPDYYWNRRPVGGMG